VYVLVWVPWKNGDAAAPGHDLRSAEHDFARPDGAAQSGVLVSLSGDNPLPGASQL
jgi:hypothetical protein